MKRYGRCAALAFGLVLCGGAACEAQLPWRGHYVRREGPHGHVVERMHWGGGLTPAGASVINQGLALGMPILGSFVGGLSGRSIEDTQTRASERSTLASCAEYAEQQRQANELLLRTAALVNGLPPLAGTPTVPPANPTGQAVNPNEPLGPNPWKIQP